MIIENHLNTYKVEMHHMVVIGKNNPLEHFKNYLNDIYKEFEQELTKSLYQMVKKDVE